MRRISSFPNLALPRYDYSVYLVSLGAFKTFMVDVAYLKDVFACLHTSQFFWIRIINVKCYFFGSRARYPCGGHVSLNSRVCVHFFAIYILGQVLSFPVCRGCV